MEEAEALRPTPDRVLAVEVPPNDDLDARTGGAPRLLRQLQLRQGAFEQPRLLRLRRRGRRGAYPVNSYNIEGNYGPAFFDAKHVFSVAGSYDLPFGKDRPFGANWNRALDAVAGGWATSVAATAHSGYPITVQNSVRRSLQGTRSAEWPNRIASGEVDNPTLDRWIDRAAFVVPALGTFGDAGVGILRAPKYWNIDLSLAKRVATVGRQYVQFRAEMFNVLNHPSFGPPNRDIQSQTFGTITSTVSEARIVQLVLKYYF